VCIEEAPGGFRSAIYSALGLLLQISIEWLVRLTGRKIRRDDAPVDGLRAWKARA